MENTITERFELRDVHEDEAEQVIDIENICFPPNEACSPESMRERVEQAPECFLAAIDKETGKVAGFLNGIATRETKFRDEFFTDISLHDPEGTHVMLLGLDVLPEYRGQGLARTIMFTYMERERKKGRKVLVLTCLDDKIEMYKRMGYEYLGISDSVWGGEQWNDMEYTL